MSRYLGPMVTANPCEISGSDLAAVRDVLQSYVDRIDDELNRATQGHSQPAPDECVLWCSADMKRILHTLQGAQPEQQLGGEA